MSGVPGINLDRLVEQAIRNVYEQKVKSGSLDAETWADNVRALWKGTASGLGIKTGYQNSTNYELAAALRQNLFVFAAFKNHHQVEDLHALLLDAQGNLRPFAEFRREALAISTDYNRNWLEAEYNTAVANGQAAVQWQDFQRNKSELPYLKYVTAGDERVRASHRLLDGVTRPVDDPFWDEWFPPNGWNCRCDVQQVAGGETDVPAVLPDDKSVPPTFRNNPGKSGNVFTLQHPYFSLVQPEQRSNIMRAAGRLIFDNYNPAQYLKDTGEAAVRKFRDLTRFPNAVGFDRSGGFIVLNDGHSAAGLIDELPVLSILRSRGAMLELLDGTRAKVKYDLFWDGHFWDIKRISKSSNLSGTLDDVFKRTRKKGKTKLLLHIDQNFTDAELKESLYHALRRNQEISLVELVWNGGRMLRLTADQIRLREWP